MNWIQRRFHQLDQMIVKKNQWNHISAAPSFYGVPRQYTGKPIAFHSTTLEPGDWIVELHLDNMQVLKEGLTPPQLFRKVSREIKKLQEILPSAYPQAKGYYGVSVFGPLLGRLGFEIQPMPNRIQGFIIGLWENCIRWIHGSAMKWHNPSVLFLGQIPKEENNND